MSLEHGVIEVPDGERMLILSVLNPDGTQFYSKATVPLSALREMDSVEFSDRYLRPALLAIRMREKAEAAS